MEELIVDLEEQAKDEEREKQELQQLAERKAAIQTALQQEFNIKPFQAEHTIELIDEGNTIPFIARYRKEQTGEMSDEMLRDFAERLQYLRNLEKRKISVQSSIEEQGKWTEALAASIAKAQTLIEVEDIYEPYKKKRSTRASKAIERGLEPLADLIRGGTVAITSQPQDYVDEEKEVPTAEDALKGACDIVAQRIAEDFELKKQLREFLWKSSRLESTEKKSDDENAKTYETYFDFSQEVKSVPPYRTLAINRGEKEGFLKVGFLHEAEAIRNRVVKKAAPTRHNRELMEACINDALKRLLLPSLERELRSRLTELAEERAIAVFGDNLHHLLLQSPMPDKVVLGWDPAYRTGCKIAVMDATGKVLATTTVYPTKPQNKVEATQKEILALIETYQVDLIAIGNGTASRESEQIVADIIKLAKRPVSYLIVNEAGASVYSASKLGTEEFPDMNVSLRGAVSIGRRVLDPLAELVKIDPEHIGVGQYQHDVNQGKLKEVLAGTVESAVNMVGVELNTASVSLLEHVAGVSKSVAKNIVLYREENGRFRSRKELLKVKRLGKAAFEQCAGFLRVKDGQNLLDKTGVHPESYEKADQLLKVLDLDKESLEEEQNIFKQRVEAASLENLSKELEIGLPTLKDMVAELLKPGRDIRESAPTNLLRSDILKIEDLKPGMQLTGTVRNVVDFGAFVDIGIKNDGLVHISKLADRFVKDPMEVVSVGDIVQVEVIQIDLEKHKVGLSMRGLKQTKK